METEASSTARQFEAFKLAIHPNEAYLFLLPLLRFMLSTLNRAPTPETLDKKRKEICVCVREAMSPPTPVAWTSKEL